jgi:hypothetical protein
MVKATTEPALHGQAIVMATLVALAITLAFGVGLT